MARTAQHVDKLSQDQCACDQALSIIAWTENASLVNIAHIRCCATLTAASSAQRHRGRATTRPPMDAVSTSSRERLVKELRIRATFRNPNWEPLRIPFSDWLLRNQSAWPAAIGDVTQSLTRPIGQDGLNFPVSSASVYSPAFVALPNGFGHCFECAVRQLATWLSVREALHVGRKLNRAEPRSIRIYAL